MRKTVLADCLIPATLYIYTCCLFARGHPAHQMKLPSARCSCGGLEVVSHMASLGRLVRLTEMEVVVLSVAKRNQEANDMNERYAWSVSCFVHGAMSIQMGLL